MLVGLQGYVFACCSGLKLNTLYLPDRHSVTSAGLAHITGLVLHTLDLTNYIHVGDEGMEHVGKITRCEESRETSLASCCSGYWRI